MNEECKLSYILLEDELNELLEDMEIAIFTIQLPDPNLPMILRDGPAKPQAVAIQEAPRPAAKPALAALVRSPDLRPSSYLVDPAHGSAALKG